MNKILVLFTINLFLSFFFILSCVPGEKNGWKNPYQYTFSQANILDSSEPSFNEISQLELDKKPSAIHVAADGRIFMALEDALLILDELLTVKGRIWLETPANCIAVAADLIFIGTRNHIEVLDQSGKIISTWADLGENSLITSLAINDEQVAVADAGNKICYIFTSSGKLVRQIRGKQENGGAWFIIPSPYFDVAAGENGTFYIVNPGRHRIEQWSADGKLMTMWGKAGNGLGEFSGCCNPICLARFSDGRFVTVEKGLGRLMVFDVQGHYQYSGNQLLFDASNTLCSTLATCSDLAVDSKGKIYFLDQKSKFLRIFELKEKSESDVESKKIDP
jgi:hypothetical protein